MPLVRLLVCLFLATVSLSTMAQAESAAKTGWYFSGKGGPSYASLGNVKSQATSAALNETSASNIVGAFGMAGGYEWMYRFQLPIRTELEFMNRTEVTYNASPISLSAGSGAVASTAQNITTMANMDLHFPVGSKTWWPFVSGGLGWAHNTLKSQYTPTGGGGALKVTKTSDSLAWSAGIGVSLKMGPDMTNDIELRHVDFGSPDWGMSAENLAADSFTANELIFSLRYNF